MNDIFHLGTKTLNEILDKCKTHGDKRGLQYINKDETPFSGETMFVKGKNGTLNQATFLKNLSPCTHCKKPRYNQQMCQTKFPERFESQMSMLMNDFNSLKNNILHNGKENKPNQKPSSQQSSFMSPPRIKQVQMRKDKAKCQVVFIALKSRSSSAQYFDSACSRHMIRDKSFFISLEDYNGGIDIFRDGSLAHVKGKGSIYILSCPKLNGVFYVNGLKANLLSISQIFHKGLKVNFCQNLCEVVNKEGKVIIIVHRAFENCYVINSNSKIPLVCSRAKLDLTKLQHRRLGHINYRDLLYLVNNEKVRGIPKLSGEPKSIWGECMKIKQTKSSQKKVKEIRTTKPLDLLHMDLMGPMCIESRGGKRNVLVVVDDFSRYSFMSFLGIESMTIKDLKSLFTRKQMEIGHLIVRIRIDRWREFDNVKVDFFCE